MKSTGIVRNLDNLGRITIPKELRNKMNMKVGNPVEIFTDNDNIVLKKFVSGCQVCGNTDYLECNGIKICKECIKKFR